MTTIYLLQLEQFSLVLWAHAHVLIFPVTTTMKPYCKDIWYPVMLFCVSNRTALLRQLADKNLKMGQNPYRLGQDRSVRFAPTFAAGNSVFVHTTSQTATTTERLPDEGWSQMMPGRHLSHRVLIAISGYLEIVEKMGLKLCQYQAVHRHRVGMRCPGPATDKNYWPGTKKLPTYN